MSIQVTIDGRLGADAEFKITGNGVAMCNLRVATSRRRKVGEAWEDYDTTWWTVTAFRAAAEKAADLRKGDRVVVVGWAKERQWETPQGEKRSRIEVTADVIGLVPRAETSGNGAGFGSGMAGSAPENVDPWADSAPF